MAISLSTSKQYFLVSLHFFSLFNNPSNPLVALDLLSPSLDQLVLGGLSLSTRPSSRRRRQQQKHPFVLPLQTTLPFSLSCPFAATERSSAILCARSSPPGSPVRCLYIIYTLYKATLLPHPRVLESSSIIAISLYRDLYLYNI